MKVFGLYGKSGTGKSHKAFEVLSCYQIEAIIDDGILIVNKKKVAGKSAKNERSMIAATKRATFFSDSHRNEVISYLKRANIQSLLIIGTSKKMIHKIIERLELSHYITWLPIEKFQTEKELKLARERRTKNYHVIPIYPASLSSTYYGKWFRKLVIRLGKRKEEIVIVKPIYLEKNRVIIAPQCVEDIVSIVAIPSIQIHKIKVDYEIVKLVVSTTPDYNIHRLVEWRDMLVRALFQSLNINYTVDVEWRSISLSSKK